MATIHIGIDDTDSPRMGCTTYIAAILAERLQTLGISFIDYPSIVRLNPNVPWKTRGNGALCLRAKCDKGSIWEIEEIVIDAVEKNADLEYEGTDPGIVFFFGKIPNELEAFAKETIRGIAKMKEALGLLKTFGGEAVGFKGGRGIIGGLAAIGETLEGDHTYELIAYRTPENRGKPRRVRASSVVEMSLKTEPLTFNNVDPETRRILITPRGPDPILYGIRGESPEIVKFAHGMICSDEPVERWMIFRTNHGTDAHLQGVNSISKIQPYRTVIARGTVDGQPRIISGGHVVFTIRDETGQIDCAAYEPTGRLREVARKLIAGDVVEACGGVRPVSSKHPLTINLEKFRVLKLAPRIVYRNPECPKCGKRMESMGKGKGFRCKKCGFRSSELGKIVIETKRDLKRGLYITSPRSQRHLTKPLCRYGREKSEPPKKMAKEWRSP